MGPSTGDGSSSAIYRSPSCTREPPSSKSRRKEGGKLKSQEELPFPPPPVRGTVQCTNASEGSVQPTVADRSAQLASARRAQSRGDRHKVPLAGPPRKKAPMTCAYCGNVVRKDVVARHRKTDVCRQALSLTWTEIATGRLRGVDSRRPQPYRIGARPRVCGHGIIFHLNEKE